MPAWLWVYLTALAGHLVRQVILTAEDDHFEAGRRLVRLAERALDDAFEGESITPEAARRAIGRAITYVHEAHARFEHGRSHETELSYATNLATWLSYGEGISRFERRVRDVHPEVESVLTWSGYE